MKNQRHKNSTQFNKIVYIQGHQEWFFFFTNIKEKYNDRLEIYIPLETMIYKLKKE